MVRFKEKKHIVTQRLINGLFPKIKQLLCLFLLMLSAACTPQPPHIQTSDKIFKKFSKQAYYRYGLILEGEGGEFYKDVNKFYFVFASFEKIEKTNVEAARERIVCLSEELLEMINTDIELRPYLRTYPFDSRNIEIIMGFSEKGHQESFINSSCIASVINAQGTILYAFFDEKTQQLADVHQESYEEAKRLVEEARGCCF